MIHWLWRNHNKKLRKLLNCWKLTNRTEAGHLIQIQGPGTTVHFWGIVWHGQLKEIPNTVQQFFVPAMVKKLQTFLGLSGHWRTFIPYLAVLMLSQQKLPGKKVVWHWAKQQQEAFDNCKNALSGTSWTWLHLRALHRLWGKIKQGLRALTTWQVAYTGPLPPSRGWWYVFTAVDTVSGLLFAKLTKYATSSVNIWFSSSCISVVFDKCPGLVWEDGIGTLLLVPWTQYQIEVQSKKVQSKPLQSAWAIALSQAIRPWVILAEGAGATMYLLLEGDDTWTVLPQRFKNSPTIFWNQLSQDLKGWNPHTQWDTIAICGWLS